MKPFNSGGHSAYQERVLAQLRKYYPDAASSLPASTRLYDIFKALFLDCSVKDGLVDLLNLSLAGDGTPWYFFNVQPTTEL